MNFNELVKDVPFDRLIKHVPLKVFFKGHLAPRPDDWTLGVWYWNKAKTIKVWGLLEYGYPTNMSYNLKDCDGKEAIARLDRFTPPAVRWNFDVGNDIYAERRELKFAFIQLGIY